MSYSVTTGIQVSLSTDINICVTFNIVTLVLHAKKMPVQLGFVEEMLPVESFPPLDSFPSKIGGHPVCLSQIIHV
jgi:hypothetical protein